VDDHLRELERGTDPGDPAAAAALLRRRIRAGEVPTEAARLLARLGDPAAVSLYPDQERAGLEETYPELVALDPLLGLRALCAGVAAGLPRFRTWLPSDHAVAMALESSEDWLVAPSPENAAAALEWEPRARESVNLVNLNLLGRYRIGQLSGHELRALEYTAWTARDAAEGVSRLESGEAPVPDSLIRLVGLWRDSGWGDLRAPLRRELRPHLLG
jgi:hypothetical protein